MALCFTHSAAGYLVYEAVRPAGPHRPALLVAAVALANGPDFDFLPGLAIGQPGVFHRGVSHTVAAVAAIAAVTWLVGWLRGRPRRWTLRASLWVTGVYASHLLLDFLTTDVRPPYGGRFLWPFSDHYYLAPVTPLREIIIDPTSRMGFLRSLVAPETGRVWIGEVGLLLLVVAAVQVVRAMRAEGAAAAREAAEPE